MGFNSTNKGRKVSEKVLYPELSYKLVGMLYEIHNSLGRYCKEKQYGDALQRLFFESRISFEREKALPINAIQNQNTNKADFVIDDLVILELKAKPLITKEDFVQMHRYLEASGLRLGLLVNFRNKYLKPIRIIR